MQNIVVTKVYLYTINIQYWGQRTWCENLYCSISFKYITNAIFCIHHCLRESLKRHFCGVQYDTFPNINSPEDNVLHMIIPRFLASLNQRSTFDLFICWYLWFVPDIGKITLNLRRSAVTSQTKICFNNSQIDNYFIIDYWK